MSVGQPERLVIHEQLDDLAVRHVADRLAGSCEAISILSVNDWSRFIEAIDESAVLSVGPAFLRAAAHAEIPVAERQHRFRLGQEFRVKRFFDDVPLVGRIIARWRPEAFMMQHRSLPSTTARSIGQSTNSPKSSTTRFAP